MASVTPGFAELFIITSVACSIMMATVKLFIELAVVDLQLRLVVSHLRLKLRLVMLGAWRLSNPDNDLGMTALTLPFVAEPEFVRLPALRRGLDRKSTRLNS